MYSCFATTNKGLEQLLATELSKLGATSVNIVNAGIQFKASLNDIMQMNLQSRLASRIMLEVGFGGYRNEEDIYKISSNIAWDKWFHVGNTLRVSTSAIQSPLKSLEFITLKVKDAICDYFVNKVDARPSVNKANPDIRVYNFLTSDTITIYLDTSGEALFKRGYRQDKLEAPLKENLAAGIIQLSNWQKEQPLFDPMCGSGTLLIEAISYALNIAPGLNRSFGFEKLMQFDIAHFDSLKVTAKQAINSYPKLKVFANDIDKRAITIAQDNLHKAGFLDYVKFDCKDFLSKSAPTDSGIVITNLPYGIRLDEQEQLAKFYPNLGNHLKSHFANWNCYFLTADLRLPKLIRLKPTRKTPLFNGALECRLFEFKMVKGPNRLITNNF